MVTARESHAPFLAECLESLSRQTWQNLQILVVPFDGGDPPVARAVRGSSRRSHGSSWSRTPERARWVQRGTPGQRVPPGTSWSSSAVGTCFRRHAIGREVGSLQQTGSDFARGAVLLGRPQPGEPPPGSRVRPVRGASVRSAPLLLSDFFVEGTVFRRSFWTQNALRFPDANGPELDATVARAYVAASTFDVVPGPGYRFMDRGSGRVVGLERDELRSLNAWLSTQDQVRSLLEGADTEVVQAWITGLMGSSLMALLESAERATPEQWQRLRTTVQEMVDLGGAGLLPRVAVVPRLLAWLAAEDRRADVEELVANRRLERNDFPTTVEDGVVYALLPLFRDSERLGARRDVRARRVGDPAVGVPSAVPVARRGHPRAAPARPDQVRRDADRPAGRRRHLVGHRVRPTRRAAGATDGRPRSHPVRHDALAQLRPGCADGGRRCRRARVDVGARGARQLAARGRDDRGGCDQERDGGPSRPDRLPRSGRAPDRSPASSCACRPRQDPSA